MPAGTYTLLVRVPEPLTVTFGAAGDRELAAGWAAYSGCAFGPGGLDRVDRHHEIATGERETRHWHVDHLLGQAATRLVTSWTTPERRIECEVHRALPGRQVDVGASDCTCGGHLRHHEDRGVLEQALDEVHELDHRA